MKANGMEIPEGGLFSGPNPFTGPDGEMTPEQETYARKIFDRAIDKLANDCRLQYPKEPGVRTE